MNKFCRVLLIVFILYYRCTHSRVPTLIGFLCPLRSDPASVDFTLTCVLESNSKYACTIVVEGTLKEVQYAVPPLPVTRLKLSINSSTI